MALCPNCRHVSSPSAEFCEQCGTHLSTAAAGITPPEGQPTVPMSGPSGPPPGRPPGPPPVPPGGPPPVSAMPGPPNGRPPWLVALAVGVGVLALVAVGLVIWLAARGGSDDGTDVATGGSTQQTVRPATSTTTTTRPPTTQAPPSNPADPTDLGGGLLCRDLKSRGYNYAEAVAYWASEGRPDRMDEDRNGYPCETVYSTAEVVAYWGFDPQNGGGGGGGATTVDQLPSGLFCRDLRARGFSYPDAVAYWNLEGQPSRMVARDLPCETVYPTADVVAYWNQFAD